MNGVVIGEHGPEAVERICPVHHVPDGYVPREPAGTMMRAAEDLNHALDVLGREAAVVVRPALAALAERVLPVVEHLRRLARKRS